MPLSIRLDAVEPTPRGWSLGLALTAALALAACSEPAAPSGAQAPSATPARAAPPAPGAGAAAPASAPHLAPLSNADLQAADLEGELRCGFSTTEGGSLLVAMGYAASRDAATGVVKIGEAVVDLRADEAGGFDAMLDGVVFRGGGHSVAVALTGAPAVGGGESPAMPATLTLDGDEGAIPGSWTCGP